MVDFNNCPHEDRSKRGRDRHGRQRWKCRRCGVTFYCDEDRALGDMRIPLDKAAIVLTMLLEGMAIRAVSRITGVTPATICHLVLSVGQRCDRFLERSVRGVAAERIELDELWDFVAMKSKTAERKGYFTGVGDAWTWLGIDADRKLILAHAVGLRDEPTCHTFLTRLNNATIGQCQVTSDGLRLYTYGVPLHLGSRVDFAQLIKTYASSQDETRYSPAKITGIEKIIRFGTPDDDLISTSYAERLNLSVRMHVRRYTRLTNAHSKTVKHHAAMTALFVGWYNYCRNHETLKTTPAVSSGLTKNRWSIQELLKATVA